MLEPVILVPKDHPRQQPWAHRAHEGVAQQTSQSGVPPEPHAYELAKKPTHEEEKIALVLFLTGGFVMWNIFR